MAVFLRLINVYGIRTRSFGVLAQIGIPRGRESVGSPRCSENAKYFAVGIRDERRREKGNYENSKYLMS